MIKISPSAKVHCWADIEDSTRGTNITIEDYAIIDAFVKIKPAGGTGDVVIGSNSVINSGCVLYTGNGIRIGQNVAIAANCTFAATNHEFKDKNKLIREQGFKESKGGIIIGNDVWIGANTVLLDGAVVEDGCVIGANSLVRGRLESFGIYAGNPIIKIGMRE